MRSGHGILKGFLRGRFPRGQYVSLALRWWRLTPIPAKRSGGTIVRGTRPLWDRDPTTPTGRFVNRRRDGRGHSCVAQIMGSTVFVWVFRQAGHGAKTYFQVAEVPASKANIPAKTLADTPEPWPVGA